MFQHLHLFWLEEKGEIYVLIKIRGTFYKYLLPDNMNYSYQLGNISKQMVKNLSGSCFFKICTVEIMRELVLNFLSWISTIPSKIVNTYNLYIHRYVSINCFWVCLAHTTASRKKTSNTNTHVFFFLNLCREVASIKCFTFCNTLLCVWFYFYKITNTHCYGIIRTKKNWKYYMLIE